MWSGDQEKATAHLKKYLALESSIWCDERSEAMKYLSDLLPHERLRWLRLSSAEAPARRETWLNLADYYYAQGDWLNLYTAAQEGLKLTQRSHNYLEYPSAWGGKLHDLAGLGAWNLGLHDASLEHFARAIEAEPNDSRIRNNYEFVQNAIKESNNG
jgi:tetratricopeptide (TPR) repeat protein